MISQTKGILCRLRTHTPVAVLLELCAVEFSTAVWFVTKYVGPSGPGPLGAGADCCAFEFEEETCDQVREVQSYGEEVGCGGPGEDQHSNSRCRGDADGK